MILVRLWCLSMLIVACDFSDDSQDLLINLERNDELHDSKLFVSVWQVEEGEKIVLPLTVGEFIYDFTIDWGDGTIEEITSLPDEGVTHVYQQAGQYKVVIDGTVEAWSFWRKPDSKDKLLRVDSLGAVGWKSLFGAFSECQQLTVVSGGDVSEVNDMSFMFSGAPLVTPDVGGWDTSNTTRMSFMFEGATLADPDVSRWYTGQVQDLSYMFAKAVSAEPEVGNWDTGRVTEMQGMFSGAERAEPEVSNWDTTRVRDLSHMFRGTIVANPDVSRWDTANVRSMAGMFGETVQAQPEVGDWNTANVRYFNGMFMRAQRADPNVSCWNTGRAIDMHNMFHDAVQAVPDVGGWNVGQVIDLRGTFNGAQLAVPDTSQWNFVSVRQMDDMFKGLSLPTSLYSRMLQRLVTTSRQQNVVLDAGNSYYGREASSARERLVANGWQITDAGPAD